MSQKRQNEEDEKAHSDDLDDFFQNLQVSSLKKSYQKQRKTIIALEFKVETLNNQFKEQGGIVKKLVKTVNDQSTILLKLSKSLRDSNKIQARTYRGQLYSKFIELYVKSKHGFKDLDEFYKSDKRNFIFTKIQEHVESNYGITTDIWQIMKDAKDIRNDDQHSDPQRMQEQLYLIEDEDILETDTADLRNAYKKLYIQVYEKNSI